MNTAWCVVLCRQRLRGSKRKGQQRFFCGSLAPIPEPLNTDTPIRLGRHKGNPHRARPNTNRTACEGSAFVLRPSCCGTLLPANAFVSQDIWFQVLLSVQITHSHAVFCVGNQLRSNTTWGLEHGARFASDSLFVAQISREAGLLF